MALFGLFTKKETQQDSTITPKHKILIAEDDQYLRDFYQELLEGEGYEIVTAADGQTALNLIFQSKPHVILLDINMPVLDGLKVLEQIQNNKETAKIPVIVFTNAGTIGNMEKSRYHHAFKFIIKSNIVPDEIITSVKAALDSSVNM